jgi:hypothetical protein
MGLQKAFMVRWLSTKSLWAVTAVWAVTYYAYFNSGDWSATDPALAYPLPRTRHGGWKMHTSKPPTMPDNRHFPHKDPRWERNLDEHNDQGFKAGGANITCSIAVDPHAAVTFSSSSSSFYLSSSSFSFPSSSSSSSPSPSQVVVAPREWRQ